jgi:hypothetical protein
VNAIGFPDGFYRAKHDEAGLLDELSSLYASESAAARLIPFGCEPEPVEWFDHRVKGNLHDPLLHKLNRLRGFRLDSTFRQAGQECSKSGHFFVLQQPTASASQSVTFGSSIKIKRTLPL